MTVVALGADHAGFVLKEALKAWLVGDGHHVLDLGTDSSDSVDYPDYAAAVGHAVAGGRAVRGILVCGTGIGMAIAANKVRGVRAAQCGDVESARLAREHNDTNVLTLGARTTPADVARAVVRTWLTTDFAGGRHARRVEKIAALGGSAVAEPEQEPAHASTR